MNETQIDELLERKKAIRVHFPKNETEFADAFLARINRPAVRHFHVWRYAAGFLIAAGLAAFGLWSTAKPVEMPADNPFVKVREAVRLFGADAAVLFIGNELVTGERESPEVPTNFVDVTLQAGPQTIDLVLACSDHDSLYLDTAGISGNVVISRCDASTLVLDVELSINGQTIRTQIPVEHQERNHYATGRHS